MKDKFSPGGKDELVKTGKGFIFHFTEDLRISNLSI